MRRDDLENHMVLNGPDAPWNAPDATGECDECQEQCAIGRRIDDRLECEHCEKQFCPDCRVRCKTCRKVYCVNCAEKLLVKGLCEDCREEGEEADVLHES